MESQLRGFHNSPADSSEKSAENSALSVETLAPRRKRSAMTEARKAALRLVKTLGLVASFRNLYIVELSITAESEFASISTEEAAGEIIRCGRAALQLGECLDYFWFEDSCWRNPKLSFKERDELRLSRANQFYASPGSTSHCDGCTRTDGSHDNWCGIAHPEEHARVKALREKLDRRDAGASA
jgi:hypothetical protein